MGLRTVQRACARRNACRAQLLCTALLYESEGESEDRGVWPGGEAGRSRTPEIRLKPEFWRARSSFNLTFELLP